jgi:hypothetical protein
MIGRAFSVEDVIIFKNTVANKGTADSPPAQPHAKARRGWVASVRSLIKDRYTNNL